MQIKNKFAHLKSVKEQYSLCIDCDLCENREGMTSIFGSGNPDARILIIGEAPGKTELYAQTPFAGDSGDYLCSLLAKAWSGDDKTLARIETITDSNVYYRELREFFEDFCFFTNVVACPTEDNKDPLKKHMEACQERLIHTIYTIDPDLIISCGATPATALLGKVVKLKKNMGRIMDVPIASALTDDVLRYGLLTIYTPSYLLMRGDQRLVPKKKGDSYRTIQFIERALSALDTMYMTETGKHYWEFDDESD